MTATTTIPVSDNCEFGDCTTQSAAVYIVTGEYGTDGVAAYCDLHAKEIAEHSENHTALSEVEHS